MRLGQLQRPLAAATATIITKPRPAISVRQLQDALGQLMIGAQLVEGRRYASKSSKGHYRLKDKSTIAKKMGAKKTGDSYVIPGNIIYKQRGNIWWAGENCGMGRDHTIFALASGYVKYYKDPKKHTKRQYIGVVFNKEDKLPYPEHAMRKRKLNMVAVPISEPVPKSKLSASGIPNQVVRQGDGRNPHPRDKRVYKLNDDYSYAEENWRLGTLVRTRKHKMGSRRRVMRRRRKQNLEILLEKRDLRKAKIARRQVELGLQRAAKARKMRVYRQRQVEIEAEKKAKAEAAAAEANNPPPAPTPAE